MSLIRIPVAQGCFAGLLGAGFVILAGGSAMAQAQIGSATVVQNEVRGHTGGEIFRIARGDNVFLDELVQTSSNSKAKVVFLDTTNMSVGPDSIVKLDQFVYNGNGTAQNVSINASKGAFRFFSGSSEHRAYKVTTPQAVIGVRGTTYDVLIANGQTYIKLQEGAVTACVRTGSTCRDLDRPGDYLIVNDRSIDGPFPSNGNTWDFGSYCGGGASDLCRKTQFAMNNTQPPPPGNGGRYQPPAPTRAASLPVDGGYAPPVYTPPARPERPPSVVTVDPPVYVPPVRVPPVYIPPYRPPHTTPPRPPRPPYPTKPPQEGKPNPGTQGTPPVILRQTGRYPTRWTQGSRWGNPVHATQMPRNPSRYGMNSPMRAAPRFSAGPRMMASPRMSQAPRMASMSRSSHGGFRR